MRKLDCLDCEDTKIILEASILEAEKLGVDMNIAVVDFTGRLMGFRRMDNAKIHSIDIAIVKAFTAAGIRADTIDLSQNCLPGKPGFGANSCLQGKIVIIGGGVAIKMGGSTIGAVGCSSGSPEEDHRVAKAGVDALKKVLERADDDS